MMKRLKKTHSLKNFGNFRDPNHILGKPSRYFRGTNVKCYQNCQNGSYVNMPQTYGRNVCGKYENNNNNIKKAIKLLGLFFTFLNKRTPHLWFFPKS